MLFNVGLKSLLIMEHFQHLLTSSSSHSRSLMAEQMLQPSNDSSCEWIPSCCSVLSRTSLILFLQNVLNFKWAFLLILQCLREAALQLHKLHSARMEWEFWVSNGEAKVRGTLCSDNCQIGEWQRDQRVTEGLQTDIQRWLLLAGDTSQNAYSKSEIYSQGIL